MIENFLPYIPLWAAGIILVILCLVGFETGRLVHRKMARSCEGGSETKSDAVGYIISAIFGLFAFIIGFTFSIAADRYDARRGWVGEEATAIYTIFLRAEFLDEPHRTRLQSAVRDYAHTRIAPDGLWNDSMDRQLARGHQLREKMWNEMRAGVFPYRDTDLGAYVIEGMNDVLTVGVRRELAGKAHIPDRILNALLLFLLVTSAVLGYLSGDQGNRLRIAACLLFVMMAMAIVLILDLDRPRSGSIQVPQTALIKLVAGLDKVKLGERPSLPAR